VTNWGMSKGQRLAPCCPSQRFGSVMQSQQYASCACADVRLLLFSPCPRCCMQATLLQLRCSRRVLTMSRG
jgi:hypothetical protein